MPVCKKIMFEETPNKMTINHKVAVLPLLDCKNNTATNKKSKQSTPGLCFTACVVFSQFEVNNEFFDFFFFFSSCLLFLYLPQHTAHIFRHTTF